MNEPKIVLEYLLPWVEIQTHDLVCSVEILEGPPGAASNIQDLVVGP